MDTEIEILDETSDSLGILESALLVCHTLPVILVIALPFSITFLLPGVHLSVAIVFSIIVSWLLYCIVAVKFLIKAMIYSEDRKALYDYSINKKLLIKEKVFSKIFYIRKKDKTELYNLLSNPTYKRNSIEFQVKTSLIYNYSFLFGSIFIILFRQDVETKEDKIKYWATIALGFLGLIYSLKRILNRQSLFILLPEGIKLPEKDIITFDKIKDFKIIRKGSGRYSSKYITFQHLSSYLGKDTFVSEELSFQNYNISVKKLNYYYQLNAANFKLHVINKL